MFRMQFGRLRCPVDCLQSHQLHQPAHPVPADAKPFRARCRTIAAYLRREAIIVGPDPARLLVEAVRLLVRKHLRFQNLCFPQEPFLVFFEVLVPSINFDRRGMCNEGEICEIRRRHSTPKPLFYAWS